MPRRLIVHKQEMYTRQARNWEQHYTNRGMVKELSSSLDVQRIISILRREIPPPELMIDGSLIVGMQEREGIANAIQCLHWSHAQRNIMCVWYWSETSWMEFVRAFQALPEVTEDYYWRYNAKTDEARLVPMSSKPKQGSKKLIPVDNLWITGSKPVDKYVDKSGISMAEKVQVS